MSSLTAHDISQTKLEGEKFDFLLHCKTCGWEARGFTAFGPSADELTKGHLGARAAYAAGDPDYVFGRMRNAPVPVLEEAKALADKKKKLEEAAAGLPKDEVVMSPMTLDEQLSVAEKFRKIDEEAAKAKAKALEEAEKASAAAAAPAPGTQHINPKDSPKEKKGWG